MCRSLHKRWKKLITTVEKIIVIKYDRENIKIMFPNQAFSVWIKNMPFLELQPRASALRSMPNTTIQQI